MQCPFLRSSRQSVTVAPARGALLDALFATADCRWGCYPAGFQGLLRPGKSWMSWFCRWLCLRTP